MKTSFHILACAFLGLQCNAAELVTEGWHHRVWSIYPVEKFKATEDVPLTAKSDGIHLTAARAESEPFVLLLRPNIPLREVTVITSDLKHTDGSTISAAQITAQRLGYVYIDEPSGSRIKQAMPYPVGTGQFPDPLLENKGEVRPQHNLQFLVTVDVPRSATPGDYKGSIKLRFRKEPWMPATLAPEDDIPLTVLVRQFALPEKSPLINTCYANLKELPESQRTPERIAALQRDFIAHRQTPEPLTPSPRIKIDSAGLLTVDCTAWEKAVTEVFNHGGSHIMIPVWGFYPEPAMAQGLYFLYHYPAVTNQKWLGAVICNNDKTLTAQFEQQFGSYLKHMHSVLKKNNWLDKAFIGTMDEPYTYHLGDRVNDTPANNYEVVRNFVTFVRKMAPGLKTFCTADPVEGLNGYIDHWCLRNLDHAAAAKERALKHGEIVTICDNYRTFIDYPAISARSFGWLAWQTGARGWMTFETMGNYRTSWEAPVMTYSIFSGATVWGMGQMFYSDPLTGAPLKSLRWELMREGCDDYEYLHLLREALKVRLDAKAQTLLESAASQIVSGGGDAETMKQTKTSNATSNSAAHQLREQIASEIERLTISKP